MGWRPHGGRFISRDTNLGQLPYAYCAGDPVNEADPGGHDWMAGLAKVALSQVNPSSAFWQGLGVIGAAGALYGMIKPPPKHDFSNLYGLAGAVSAGGTGIGVGGAGLGMSGGVGLGGALLGGGLVIVGTGCVVVAAAGALYFGGRYFGWW